jgi:cellulose synthase/poly-beta-1,6-N-acetylglucosamine synthase-like glycosyltransferase
MAYNEEANIGELLQALRVQNLDGFRLVEIVVVASGCTDRTEELVREGAREDARVRLISQPKREGKASAVNLFLRSARGELIILESADTLPSAYTLQRLLEPFADPKVGMTGAHPRPVDSGRRFMGYSTHFLWWMHHNLALRRPKLGELVAFRRIVESIPEDTAVDEAAIEAAVSRAGLAIAYAPNAIVHNKGPETLREYLVQRRRIVAGHWHLYRTQGYRVSSTAFGVIFRRILRKIWTHMRMSAHLVREGRFRYLRKYLKHHSTRVLYVGGAIAMEGVAYGLGSYDYYVLGKNPYVWEVAPSTKKLS